MNWYFFFIIISSATAVRNSFCRRSSVWHRPWVKSPSPLFRTTRWWLWRAKCRGTAARLCLQKYFCSGSCQHSGEGARGVSEESRKIPRRRNICVSARPSKRYPTASEEKWLFFTHWAFFRRLASLPSTKWSCQFVFPPHRQEPLGVRKQSRRGLNGTRAQKRENVCKFTVKKKKKKGLCRRLISTNKFTAPFQKIYISIKSKRNKPWWNITWRGQSDHFYEAAVKALKCVKTPLD